jgi:hypothetical protein
MIFDIEDLVDDVPLISLNEDLVVERGSHNGLVSVTIRHPKGKNHHFTLQQASPGLSSVDSTYYEMAEVNTPIHSGVAKNVKAVKGAAMKENRPSESLRKRVDTVRTQMVQKEMRNEAAIEFPSMASPLRMIDDAELAAQKAKANSVEKVSAVVVAPPVSVNNSNSDQPNKPIAPSQAVKVNNVIDQISNKSVEPSVVPAAPTNPTVSTTEVVNLPGNDGSISVPMAPPPPPMQLKKQ